MFWNAVGALQILSSVEETEPMMQYTYLLVNLATIFIPFLFSFHPKLKFYRTWRSFFPAVIITGIAFIIWDIYFTHLGVWGFNESYLTGIQIVNLPVEEVLFFLCIPYACVFTYHCLDILIEKTPNRAEPAITLLLMIILTMTGILCFDKLYTVSTFLSLAAMLAFAKFVLKINWLGRFYMVYAILLFPFLIVNGILTGTGLEQPVVWYDNTEIIGFRIKSIPIEDVFYGMELILVNLVIYKRLLHKQLSKRMIGLFVKP